MTPPFYSLISTKYHQCMNKFLAEFLPAKLTHRLILLGLFISTAIAGSYFELFKPSPQAAPQQTGSEIHLGRTEFTNPLLDYLPSDSLDPNLISLKKKLGELVTNFKNRDSVTELSVFYRDLDTGDWFGINEAHPYAPASLMKVTLMVVYYKLAETNPELLEEEIEYDGQYANESNLPPAQMLAIGERYSIDELINRMIANSDNIARSILSAYLDKRYDVDVIDKLAGDSEIIVPSNYEKRYQYEITTKDYSRIFRVLYNTSYLSDTMSEKALHLLAQSSYDSGIVNGIPSDVVVANKFGFSDNPTYEDKLQFHDCGIVYTENNPYILCVMTKTTDITAAQEAISSVSQMIYRHLHDHAES